MENTMHMLQFLIEVFCAVLFVGIAAVLGTLAAAKCLPFDPAEWVEEDDAAYWLRQEQARFSEQAAARFDELAKVFATFAVEPAPPPPPVEATLAKLALRMDPPAVVRQEIIPVRQRTKTLAMGGGGNW